MAGSSSKDFECITRGYLLRDYLVCITKEIFSYLVKSKRYKVFYTQGVRCVCVCVGGGGGGTYVMRNSGNDQRLLRKGPVQISNWAVVFHYS